MKTTGIAFGGLLASALSLWAQPYTFKVVENFQPNAINNKAVIVGQGGVPILGYYRFEGFYTTVIDPSVAGGQTVLLGVNGQGAIVGASYTGTGGYNRGFLLENGVFTTITINGEVTTPSGINDFGTIVGTYGNSFGFVLKDGTLTTLPNPAIGINNRGDIVGNLPNGMGYILENGVLTPILVPGSVSTTVIGVNDQRDVVGTYGPGFVLRNGVYTTIRYPADAYFTYVNGINDSQQITGFSIGPSGITAFIGIPSGSTN